MTLPCIICNRELESAINGIDNQPYKGTMFTTKGHYGSTVFDPLTGARLEINLCDPCLTDTTKAGKVLYYPVQPRSHLKASIWKGEDGHE